MKNNVLLFSSTDRLPAGYQKAQLTIGWKPYKQEDFATGFFSRDIGALTPTNGYTALFVHDNDSGSNHGGIAVLQNGAASDFYYKDTKYSAGQSNTALLNEWLGLKNQTVEVWIRKGGGRKAKRFILVVSPLFIWRAAV